MKTLDEVIKAAECCADVTSCKKCPYWDRRGKIMACMDKGHGKNVFLEDALYYLKYFKSWKGVPTPVKE